MKGFKQQFENQLKDTPNINVAQLQNFPAHWHIQCEIVFILDGQLTVGINNLKKTIEKNSIAISGSNCVHYYQEGYGNQLLCIFHPALLGQNLWQKDVQLQNPILNSVELPQEIKNKCMDLIQDSEDNSNPLIKKGDLITLCGLIEDLLPTVPKPTLPPYADIQKALEFIENNFIDEIDLNKISDYCNVSKYHFSRKFGTYTGMNLHEYINTLRIEYSEDQLLTTDKKIVEIAYESGFGSLRSFNRVFMKIKDKTPSEVRSGRINLR